MTRIEKLLNSKGRQIIGWDEILEGDVAPNATVMSLSLIHICNEASRIFHGILIRLIRVLTKRPGGRAEYRIGHRVV